MKVCILGDGLTSLTLAKALVNLGIKVDIYSNQIGKKYNRIRTIGVSKSNLEFFNKNIINIEKLSWDVKKIEIYSEILNNERILKFQDNNQKLFSIIRNYQLITLLLSALKKNKLVSFRKKINSNFLNNNNYNLIFNCEHNNLVTKKIFFKKIKKNYNSFAYTTIIKHKKIINNDVAIQTFTKDGPIAFLPVSSTETSIVYSIKGRKKINLKKMINKYNKKYENIKLNQIFNFELKSVNLRSYYYKNILAFGDLLHKLHPLAGQGFNMSIRDISEISKIIKFRLDHGLDLDYSVCSDFEKNNKHKNYLFSNGIDFIHEFFSLENKIENNLFSKSVKFLGKNKITNNIFKNFADKGLVI